MAESYIAGIEREAFLSDHMRLNATERSLERLIEAAIKIGEERMGQIYPELPLHEIRGMGNRLRRSYDLIDAGTVYNTVKYDIPLFRAACEAALKKSPSVDQ